MIKKITLAFIVVLFSSTVSLSLDSDVLAYRQNKTLAEMGFAEAQYNVGVHYAFGEGIPKNYVRAYAWWSIAATQGYEDAKTNLDIVIKMLTPNQLAEGQKLAAEYWEKYVVPFQ